MYKYPVYIDTKKYKGYEYQLVTCLHHTFNFLLKKSAEKFWKWTLGDKEPLLGLLGGLVDAEEQLESRRTGIIYS